ncbi:MAG TPA: hypothetical protein P5137_05545 [Candidatus Brocadiia bacterium]|nr:hypothetical protein [Candidatus Brocadiia bacterium]
MLCGVALLWRRRIAWGPARGSGCAAQDSCRFYDTLPSASEAEERVVEAVRRML